MPQGSLNFKNYEKNPSFLKSVSKNQGIVVHYEVSGIEKVAFISFSLRYLESYLDYVSLYF